MIWYIAPRLILALFIVSVVVWDIAANCAGHYESTVSAVLYDMSSDWPVIAFVFGFLCGHAFWKNT